MAIVKPFERNLYDFTKKNENVMDYIQYMLIRTRQMFKYENLPDTIPENMLEYYLQMNGVACITDVRGKLYALMGGWGGEPDAYYRPTKYSVANPALNISKTLEIGKDCVLIYNDSRYMGLRKLFERYATAMVENDLTINLSDILARCTALLTAGDDRSRLSAEKFLADIKNGKLGVIADNSVLEAIKTQPYTQIAQHSITDLIELQQYLKASWFNELGLSANYNMKREAINSSEAQLGQDSLLPLVDDLLHCREEWVAQVNALYGTNIVVKYHSAWANDKNEIIMNDGGLQNDEATENPEATETTEDPVLSEPNGQPDETTEPTGTEATEETTEEKTDEKEQLEDQDFTPDDERAVETADHVIEVPVTDQEVIDAGGGEEPTTEILPEEQIEGSSGGETVGSDESVDGDGSDGDENYEDFSRNLQKRIKRGNV